MANLPISEREKMAWEFAEKAHKDQLRRFLGTSYFNAHVANVNGIVKFYTRDEDMLIAALLHDVVEDCYEDKEEGFAEIERLFGKEVSDLVRELTSDDSKIKKYGKAKYLIKKMSKMTDKALVIKLADRLQNISDAFTAPERFRNSYFRETESIVREIEKVRDFNRIQTLLINQIKMKLNNISSIFKIQKFEDFAE